MNDEDENQEGASDERLTQYTQRATVRTLGGLVASFIAAGGIILGALEYKQRSEMIQARETLQLVNVWDQDGARDAYRDLAEAVSISLSRVSSSDLAVANESRAAYNKLRLSISREILKDPKNAEQFDEVVYFFTRLSLCVEARLCDTKSSDVFFEDTLSSFLDVFRTYLKGQTSDAPGYGQALFDLQEKFALE